jgi:hypothetical protein
MPISAPAMGTSRRTLTAALEAGDLQTTVAAFRQDIVFHSPILATIGDVDTRRGTGSPPTLCASRMVSS